MAEPTRSASARGKSARIRHIQQASLIYRKLFRWRQTYIVLSPQNPNDPIWGVNLPQERFGLGAPHVGAVLAAVRANASGLPDQVCD